MCFVSCNNVLRKVSLAKLEKNFLQSKLSIQTEKNVYSFESDKSDVAVSASEFLIVDLDNDEDEDIYIM